MTSKTNAGSMLANGIRNIPAVIVSNRNVFSVESQPFGFTLLGGTHDKVASTAHVDGDRAAFR